ncbi:MAG: ABC transporter substrate-binding protein [Nevskiales bacterium]
MPKLALLWALLVFITSGAAVAHNPPHRVVSINLCADVFLLHLADREQITSLTFLAARSPLSPVHTQAQGLPSNKGQLEEVLALQPDLVVSHRYGNIPLVKRLEQLDVPVFILEAPTDVPAVYREIERFGQRLGQQEKAQALLKQYDARLAALSTAQAEQPVLAVYGPNGITSGPGSLLHDILTRAGFRNLASQLGIGSVGTLRMEALISNQPDALLFSDNGSEVNSLARQKLQHPALQRLAASRPSIRLPGKLWTCGGPELLQAAHALRQLRLQVDKLAP